MEPGDSSASLVHHLEDDDVVARLLPHVGSAEAKHELGKLEARDASLDDTKLHSDAVENEMDVGHGTGDDVPGGEFPPRLLCWAHQWRDQDEGIQQLWEELGEFFISSIHQHCSPLLT